jgi:rhodanese-related sulfurtransferase
MKKVFLILLSIFLFAYSASCTENDPSSSNTGQPASGTVENGYRILSIRKTQGVSDLTVFRGDYIKFQFDVSVGEPILSIPALSIEQKLPDNPKEAPYFKMKTAGTFAYSLGAVRGNIIVLNYVQARYREVSSNEAAELIKNEQPVILDVRTSGEYSRGHLQNAVLLPVQQLQGRLGDLAAYKDREILVYCATGNRSTVASKILIDNGFKQIVNMRHGIYDWAKKNFPVTR